MILYRLAAFVSAAIVVVACLSLTPDSVYAETKSTADEQSGADASAKAQTPFDFDYYAQLIQPVPERELERLCGLDKVCVTMWKEGRLQVFREGRIIEGDFNCDGIKDEAIVLEKDDDPDDPVSHCYYIYISCKDKDGRKVLLHELIPEAKNVIDVFWDPVKKVLVIDTGGRVVKTEHVTTTTGYGGTGFEYRAGQVQKVVVVVSWNPKLQKFELIVPTLGKRKRA